MNELIILWIISLFFGGMVLLYGICWFFYRCWAVFREKVIRKSGKTLVEILEEC